jgi:organic hydroperoxide reductase OsmC/OhrA
VSARRFEYAASVDRDGRIRADGAHELELDDAWTPEHLVLAGLASCMLTSLDFHAKRRNVSARGSAAAEGLVTTRDDDGRYAFVEVECGLDVELDPLPAGDELVELLDLAERDCFIGASLTAKPRYEWRVNGELVR